MNKVFKTDISSFENKGTNAFNEYFWKDSMSYLCHSLNSLNLRVCWLPLSNRPWNLVGFTSIALSKNHCTITLASACNCRLDAIAGYQIVLPAFRNFIISNRADWNPLPKAESKVEKLVLIKVYFFLNKKDTSANFRLWRQNICWSSHSSFLQ